MTDHIFGITDKGKRREKNEDSFIAEEISNKKFLIACVIDGVGGYNGGEVAADITRTVIMEYLQDLSLSVDVIETLQNAIIAANEKIFIEKKRGNKHEQMACVLTCAVTDIKNNKFYYAHVGDTRLYLLRDHSLVKISKDHSVIGFLEESGRLSEEDAMRHPRRNEITKALGFEEHIHSKAGYIETGESPFLPGDAILLCSDGLSDMISSNTMMSFLTRNKSLIEKVHDLVNAANDAGGNDNITVVLAENNKQPLPQAPIERKKITGTSPLRISKAPSQQETVNAEKRKSSLFKILYIVALGLFGLLLISLLQRKPPSKPNNITTKNIDGIKKNENLDLLISKINDTTKTYSLSQGIFFDMNDPIVINKDSFHLQGNGAIIKADSNYNGPAFIINSSAKQILLDSLVFENFNVAIIVQKNNITFRKVRFINCKVPVQYILSFPDSVVSGRFKDSIFTSTLNKIK